MKKYKTLKEAEKNKRRWQSIFKIKGVYFVGTEFEWLNR